MQSFPAWSEKGIVGRGVLIDYHTWRLKNNIPYDPFKSDSIPLEHLKAVLQSQGTELKFGDILIIRSGDSSRVFTANSLMTARLHVRLQRDVPSRNSVTSNNSTPLFCRCPAIRRNVGMDLGEFLSCSR